MATTDAATTPATPSTDSEFGMALAQPTISFIQGQITASLPSQLASSITAQFPAASAGSNQGTPSVQIPAASTLGAASALGTALAQPAIQYIQQQISAGLPSQLASLITAQFPSASGQAAPAAQPATVAAALQALVPSSDLKSFFSALGTQSA